MHIKKHDMMLGDYYVKHYQRRNKLTGELLPFKNCKEYFEKDFSQPGQLKEWCQKNSDHEVREYILKLLKKRISDKELDYGPTNLELISSGLPSVDTYKKYFGSYTNACKMCNVKPLLYKQLPKSFFNDFSKKKILIDTREQKPLTFPVSEKHKLDIGDYAVGASDYNYTYVDRKSFGDFCGTVTTGYSRFCRELDRCESLGAYMFIVVEISFRGIEGYNKRGYKRFNLDYVCHNMREIQKKYKESCQFIFAGSREFSQELIPKLLILGKDLWHTDVDYFWSKYAAKKYYQEKANKK
jgi:hypothetical protein